MNMAGNKKVHNKSNMSNDHSKEHLIDNKFKDNKH